MFSLVDIVLEYEQPPYLAQASTNTPDFCQEQHTNARTGTERNSFSRNTEHPVIIARMFHKRPENVRQSGKMVKWKSLS